MKITAVIPSFNEAAKIGEVIREVARYTDEIIVIDDGSKDETALVAEAAGAKVYRFILNRGQGAALQAGFTKALERGAEVVITFDADGQFDAAEIPLLVQPILDGEAEVALGSRLLGKTNMPRIKKLFLRAAVWLSVISSGLPLSDTHNGFRALSRKALSLIHLTQDRMAHASEIIEQIAAGQLVYVEVPVTVRYTDYSLQKGQKLADYFKILADLSFKKLLR